MPHQHGHHQEHGSKVVVAAEQRGGQGSVALVVHQAQDGKRHADAVGRQSEPAHGWQQLHAEAPHALLLKFGEEPVEVGLLPARQRKAHGLGAGEAAVELEEASSQTDEPVVQRIVFVAGKDIVPCRPHGQRVEEEPGEEAVLGVGNQRAYLSGRAAEQDGQAGHGNLHVFAVFPAVVGDGLVVEGLAQAVAVVAVLAAEGGGQRVALGLEHQGPAVIVVQRLEEGRGGAVGRDEEHPDGRLLRLFALAVFPPLVVERLPAAILFPLLAVAHAQVGVHHVGQMAAQGEPALARRGLRADEQEEVGKHLPLPVKPPHLRQAGREHGECPQQQDVGVFGREAVGTDVGEQARQRGVHLVGERRKRLRPAGLLPAGGVLSLLAAWGAGSRRAGRGAGGGSGKISTVLSWQSGNTAIHARLPCQVKEGGRRDAMPPALQAGGVLLVGFGRLIAGVEAAQAVKVGAAFFAQPAGQGEAQVAPVVVGGSYVRAHGLDACGDNLHLRAQIGGGTLPPSVRVEFLCSHVSFQFSIREFDGSAVFPERHVGIPGQVAGACHVASRRVGGDVVGVLHVAGQGVEPFGMVGQGGVYGHHPLQAVASGAAENQGEVHFLVVEQDIAQAIYPFRGSPAVPLVHVVEVEAQQAAVLHQGVAAAPAEDAAEGGVVEVRRLEALHLLAAHLARLLPAAQPSQLFGGFAVIVAPDGVVDLP